MNQYLQDYARSFLKENLAKLPEDWQTRFIQIYGHKNPTRPINEIIDDMSTTHLDHAMTQVVNSINKINKLNEPYFYAKSERPDYKPCVIAISLDNIVELKASGVIIQAPDFDEAAKLLAD